MLACRSSLLRSLRLRQRQHPSSALAAATASVLDPHHPLLQLPSHKQQEHLRTFHATPRREILPLIGVATVFVIGRYSYKAMQRMDAEWEDYQWELQQYERQLAQSSADGAVMMSNQKTIAIDLGSVYTKLATSHQRPEVIVSREGDRAFFNGILYEEGGQHLVRARHALERFYYPPPGAVEDGGDTTTTATCPVTLPWNVLEGKLPEDDDDNRTAQTVVTDVLAPALDEVLERLDYPNDSDNNNSGNAAAAADDDDVQHAMFRSVVTLPARYYADPTEYSAAFSEIATTLLPEPVAAIWGAQAKGLLPVMAGGTGHGSSVDDSDETTDTTVEATAAPTTLVVDVGGQTTQLSVVQKDVVLSSISLPWGGERWIQLLVDLLIADHKDKVSVQDVRSLAALQLQARTAVTELSSKTRVDIHVPYIFAEPGNHHLDTTMSRNVFEQAIQQDIREHLASAATSTDNTPFSPHMPPPTDMASLWMSATTAVLEYAQKLPTDLNHVLLVGGASRTPLVSTSLQEALYLLMGARATAGAGSSSGSSSGALVVVPESAVASELTVLGAATLLPNYVYSVEGGGLHRLES